MCDFDISSRLIQELMNTTLKGHHLRLTKYAFEVYSCVEMSSLLVQIKSLLRIGFSTWAHMPSQR